MSFDFAKVGRTLLLAAGTLLTALGLVSMVVGSDLNLRLVAALVFASGIVLLLLAVVLDRLSVFSSILRHVQYLTQASEYTARLLREITEVMRAIQTAEAEERKKKQTGRKGRGTKGAGELDEEELEIDRAVRQFED
jgi:hypothetical protein